MMPKHPMTKKGAQSLKEMLQRLKTQDRLTVIKAIEEARAHGDLKENAEYHAAKEQQSFIERNIARIEQKLANNQIIDPSQLTNTGKVVFGSTIHLMNIETKEKVVYQIVGEDESNIQNRKISFQSPVAKALIGKEIGDQATVHIPIGTHSFEIINIEYI